MRREVESGKQGDWSSERITDYKGCGGDREGEVEIRSPSGMGSGVEPLYKEKKNA